MQWLLLSFEAIVYDYDQLKVECSLTGTPGPIYFENIFAVQCFSLYIYIANISITMNDIERSGIPRPMLCALGKLHCRSTVMYTHILGLKFGVSLVRDPPPPHTHSSGMVAGQGLG
jgi:hypothetical protein